MPVTAKLSRNFYEKLGDDVANELVEWFNSVDASYKLELRAIVASELKGTSAELRGELATEAATLRQEMKVEFAAVRREMATEFAAVRREMATEFAAVRGEMKSEIGALRAELIKWSFVFFATAALAVIGLR